MIEGGEGRSIPLGDGKADVPPSSHPSIANHEDTHENTSDNQKANGLRDGKAER